MRGPDDSCRLVAAFEPGTGEINYRAVAAALREAGYSGVIGMEAASGGADIESGDTALAAFRAAFEG